MKSLIGSLDASATAQRAKRALNPNGCIWVDANVNMGASQLITKGWMTGCAWGDLRNHVYTNNAHNGQRIDDHGYKDCPNTRGSCSTPTYYDWHPSIAENTGDFDVYNHGFNLTTKNDAYAYMWVRHR